MTELTAFELAKVFAQNLPANHAALEWGPGSMAEGRRGHFEVRTNDGRLLSVTVNEISGRKLQKPEG